MANKDPDLLKLLEKAAEQLDSPDTATTDDLLSGFFQNLEAVIMEQIPTQKGAGPFTKSRLQGMFDVLDTVTKMTDADLAAWLGISSPFRPAKGYDHGPAQRFDASTRPDDPNAGIAATPPAKKDKDDWVGTPPHFPGTSTGRELRGKLESATVVPSSSPAPGFAKALGDFLDSMDGATPEEIDRAKSGLSQLDPAVATLVTKAIEERGQLLQSLEFDAASPEEEQAMYMGALLSEAELRKGIIVSSAKLLERVAKLRDTELAKQVVLEGDDKGDDWEQRARRGNA